MTSGDEENRITGETLLTVDLPYLYREAIDLDFSGSPVDGRNYPTEYEYGERYTQGMDGIPADTPYTRPGGGGTPAVDTEFVFQPGADFFFANPGVPETMRTMLSMVIGMMAKSPSRKVPAIPVPGGW